MRPSEVVARHKQAMRAIVARYPVGNPRLFGSVARGEDADTSDVDLLVDARDGTTLFDLAGLQAELESLLGVRVDIVSSGGLGHRKYDAVLSDASPL